jgi:ATP-dependent Clp protease ATP-binding subunit ClpC
MRGVDPPAGDDWLILALALGAMAVAYALGRRAGARPAAAPAAEEPGGPEPTPAGDTAQVPDSAALYRAGDRLREFFEAAAQPTDLLANDDFREGVQLLCDPAFGVNDLVAYVNGDSQVIACFAAQALRERREPDASARLLQSVGTLGPWSMYFVLRYLHEATGPEQALVGRVLAGSVGYLAWRQPAQFLEDFVRDRAAAGEVPGFGDELARVDTSAREPLERFVAALEPDVRGTLLEDFHRIVQQRGDVELLDSIGMLWDPSELEADDSVDHADFEEAVEALEAGYSREPSRSVLLVGERGVGKSAIAHRVARRLQARGWQIFEASPADLVAGQIHIGEFEGQLRKLLARLGSGRILWIVPEFPSLALSGRHHYSSLSALDTILPELERGRIALLGECLPGAYERLVLSNARVATALEVRRVKPLPAEATVALARTWLADRALLPERGEELLVEAWQLAQQFLAGRSAPGNLMRLLRITVQRLAASDATAPPRLRLDDLVATLGATTGLPSVLLDEREALDLDGLRALFGRRVIGQQEAVDCLVERVAMVKAGLTDPSRPFGVFLFAGPTGTGKTEIAKTLAEFLFGSPERMIRIDMSELQGYEDVERLLGGDDPEKSQALVDRIRKQPFSVVLLDEFEKAHPRVWDLFLQLFDDGRLTDRRGNTADFRCAIVILTSNLGGVIPAGDRPGFSDGPDDRQGEFSARSVLRALSRAFRPEFLNRLDRIVVFRPLDRETMRGILRRELADVFLRRGLRSREWAVEWDPSAIEFLLEEGFTPDMGARPLKRAIERHLLAPLASTIVSHRVPRGDQFLYITCRDDALAVEFVDPDAQPPDAASADAGARDGSLSLRSIALSPRGSAAEIAFLGSVYDGLQSEVAGDAWREQRQTALDLTELPEFWSSPDRFEILSQVEYQGRIEAGLRRTGSTVARLRRQAGRGAPAQLTGSLAHGLYLLEHAVTDVREGRPHDAFVLVEGDGFADDVGRMYRAWARNRRMQVTVLDERAASGDEPARLLLAVGGYGCHSILAAEDGVHLFEQPATAGRGFDRSRARVSVLPQTGPGAGPQDLRREAERALAEAAERSPPRVVRRYRNEPSPLVRDGVRGWRTGRLDHVMDGDFDLLE